MLKHSHVAVAAFIFVIIGALWLAKLSPSYRECDANRKQDPAYHESANSQAERARRFVICEGAFFDANKEAITAGATIAIAIFTLVLWLATSRNARLTTEIIALTRQEFRASHRPLLVIHAIRIREFDQSRRPDDQPLRAEFAVINAGTSAGCVTGSAVHLEYLPQTDRPYLHLLQRNDVIRPGRFEVGASNNHIPVCSDQWGGLNHVGAAASGKILYFCGWVVYKDERGYARTTYFCRQFSRFPGSNIDGRFIPVDDPECEKTY